MGSSPLAQFCSGQISSIGTFETIVSQVVLLPHHRAEDILHSVRRQQEYVEQVPVIHEAGVV
jgi:hypothetical protein